MRNGFIVFGTSSHTNPLTYTNVVYKTIMRPMSSYNSKMEKTCIPNTFQHIILYKSCIGSGGVAINGGAANGQDGTNNGNTSNTNCVHSNNDNTILQTKPE